MSKFIELARKTLLVTFATALLLEGALRLWNPVKLRVRGTTLSLPTHSTTVIENQGSAKLEKRIRVSRNSLGFRGEDPPEDFESRLTLVTVGGSTTECVLLSDGKTWTDVMARRLATDFPSAWVNNAGLDGHSTFGHLQLCRQLIVPLRPDYVLILAGVNDVDRDDISPFDRHSLLESQGLLRRCVAASELLCTLQALVRVRRAHDLGVRHIPDLEVAAAPTGSDDPQRVDAHLRTQRETLAPRFGDRLRELIGLLRAADIEPVLLTQPSMYAESEDLATAVRLGAQRLGDWTVATHAKALAIYNDVTREVARDQRVHLIDLAARMPLDSRLYYDWVHYSNEGAEEVGRIVVEDLAPFLRERDSR